MTIINPRSSIISLTAPVPESLQGRMRTTGNLEEKVGQIRNILKQYPELQQDSGIMKRVITFTGKSRDREIQEFRKRLITDLSCQEVNGIIQVEFPDFIPDSEKRGILFNLPSEKGRFDVDKGSLTLTKEALENIQGGQLWSFAEQHDVNQLVIRQNDGKLIIYEGRVLEQLIAKKPSVEALTETYVVKFPGGEELTETKAKLLLYGDHFEGVLGHEEAREVVEKTVDLSETKVTFNGFCGILQSVETGEKGPEVLDDLYEIACDYLQYVEFTYGIGELPEGTFGPAEWQCYFGLTIEGAPPVPAELLKSLDQPCPFFTEGEKKVSDTQALFLVPKGLSINEMGELAKNPVEGHKVEKGYRFLWDKIKDQYGDEAVQESYWVLMTKDVIPDSRVNSHEAQLVMASSAEGYEAPSLLEAIICNYVEHVHSGERLFGSEPCTYTCCREEPIDDGYKLIVGSFFSEGLHVNDQSDYYGRIGVAWVRRK